MIPSAAIHFTIAFRTRLAQSTDAPHPSLKGGAADKEAAQRAEVVVKRMALLTIGVRIMLVTL